MFPIEPSHSLVVWASLLSGFTAILDVVHMLEHLYESTRCLYADANLRWDDGASDEAILQSRTAALCDDARLTV